jgi:tetratricopeptide (TPR) repeat protein
MIEGLAPAGGAAQKDSGGRPDPERRSPALLPGSRHLIDFSNSPYFMTFNRRILIDPISRRAWFAAMTAGLLFFAWGTLPGLLFSDKSDRGGFIRAGEIFIHGLAHPDYHLPMPGVAASLMFQHCPRISAATWRLLAGGLFFTLLMAVGGIVGGPWQALCATAMLLFSTWLPPWDSYKVAWFGGGAGYFIAFFSLLVILVAGVGAWRASAPSPRRSLVLGLAIGASLLYRSTLVFLPLILAFSETLPAARKKNPHWRRSAAALCFTPYFFLAPWIAMNWVVNHRLIVLEGKEADTIIVEGALGYVTKVGWALEPGNVPGYDGAEGSVLAWAVREVAVHPLRYARGYLGRLGYLFSLQPALVSLALLGFWLERRKPEVREVGLLCGYYVFIHCFMAIDPEHFDPLWPLLAILAASLIHRFKSNSLQTDVLFPSFCRAVLRAWFIAVLALALVSSAVVGTYALRQPLQGDGLDLAITRNPDDDVLWLERGQRRLASGDVPGAVSDIKKAVILRPGDIQRRAVLAWARLLQGEREEFLTEALPRESEELGSYEALLFAHGFLLLGMRDQAAAHLSHFLEFGWTSGPSTGNPAYSKTLHCGQIGDYVWRTLNRRPAREAGLVFAEIERLSPGCVRYPWGKTREFSSGSSEPSRGQFEEHSKAMHYQELGHYDLAVSILNRLIAAEPAEGRGRLLSDRAVCEYLRGRPLRAIADLEAAIRLDSAWIPSYLTLASIHASKGRYAEAAAVYRRALKIKPHDSLILAGQADLISRREVKASHPF